jgi:signal transduction histidine kinase
VTAAWRGPALVDGLLAAGLLVAVGTAVAVSTEVDARRPDAFAYALVFAMAALVPARRRWPLAVLLATSALLLAYYARDYPGITPALPLSVALASAAASRGPRWPAVAAVGFLAAELASRRMPVPIVLGDLVQDAALLLALILLGLTIRGRQERVAAAEERVRREEVLHRLDAERRVAEERVRIARDVHDIVGHTVAAMTVQAGLAADLLDDDPAQALEALQEVRSQGRAAIAELRTSVTLLRSGNGPTRGLADLAGLAEVARTAGLGVTLDADGDPDPPAVVGSAAYRIVQEALTNVLRHAGATAVRIRLRATEAELAVEVVDDGVGPRAPGQAGGHGMAGMAERAASAGGRLETGPGDGPPERPGVRVRAVFPRERR